MGTDEFRALSLELHQPRRIDNFMSGYKMICAGIKEILLLHLNH